MTFEEHYLKGKKLFGTMNVTAWKFKCPCCGQPFVLSELIEKGININLLYAWLDKYDCGVIVADEDGKTHREFEFYGGDK